MPFKNILVALDGSEYSEYALNHALWLATALDAKITGQHVVDPRMVDLFIAPEFAEELGFQQSIETSEKVFHALKRIGNTILDLFSKQAFTRGFKTDTFLDVGYTIEEIVKRSENHDLLVLGHRGKGHKRSPAELMVGSVAERVSIESDKPVLVAMTPPDSVEQILVAYDGSEPARGALLASERLALETGKRLKVLTVIPTAERLAEAQLNIEQAQSYLRELKEKDVFEIREGHPAKTLIEYANQTQSLIVMGAYGYRAPDSSVLGTTTTYVLRRTRMNVLIFR
jgi:nucleotide-binding universal stress UspA family protein